jgi:YVTN family beta-propeller protein
MEVFFRDHRESMNLSLGVPMTVWRVDRLAAVLILTFICTSCGDTFRPVAIPITPPPPDPSSLHYALVLTSNGTDNPGASSRIDVSGDTNVGTAKVGLTPVHAALLPNGARVYVANHLEDTISVYNPSGATGTNAIPVTTVSLAPPGTNCTACPVFVHTTQSDAVYVANSGTNTVSIISTASNVVTNTIPVGVNPSALAETPDAKKLYVANQGDGTVTSINTLDKSTSSIPGLGLVSPVWVVAVARDAATSRAYVLDSVTGAVLALDTFSDLKVGTASVGAGANFMLHDKTLSRLYVTNPIAATLTVIDASSDALTVLKTISFTGTPVSVAALPDGSRVYVASYQINAACTAVTDTPPCITSQVTVIKASDNTVTKTIAITLPDTAQTPPTSKPDTPKIAACDSVRFRLFAVAAADSSRVYVAYCDGGSTAIIRTTPNTSPGSENPGDYLVLDLPAPVSSLPPPAPGQQPPPENPVFVLAGP